MAIFCIVCNLCQAQHLELTKEGMRSTEDSSKVYVEYGYLNSDRSTIENYFNSKVKDIDYFKYQVIQVNEHKWRIKGYLDSPKLIIFGKSEIQFQLNIDFDPSDLKISCDLFKSSGKPLKFGLLFAKSGKVRIHATKTFIEDEINGLIQKTFEDRIIIK